MTGRPRSWPLRSSAPRSTAIKEYERFEAIAAQHRRDGEEATLDNVRERCARSEIAWLKMAAQSRRTEERRTEREQKAAMAMEMPVPA